MKTKNGEKPAVSRSAGDCFFEANDVRNTMIPISCIKVISGPCPADPQITVIVKPNSVIRLTYRAGSDSAKYAAAAADHSRLSRDWLAFKVEHT